MHVRDAVAARRSVRRFTDQPVPDATLRDLLGRSARAPSGGNLQPWRIFVVNADAMVRFRVFIADRQAGASEYDGPSRAVRNTDARFVLCFIHGNSSGNPARSAMAREGESGGAGQ